MTICEACGAAKWRLAPVAYVFGCVLVAGLYGWLQGAFAATLTMLLWGVFSCTLQLGWEHLRRQTPVREQIRKLQARLEAVYNSRGVLALAFCRLALQQGYRSGIYVDPDPETRGWSIASVVLPQQGEVAWHVAQTDAALSRLPMMEDEWDGREEHLRDARLKGFAFDCCCAAPRRQRRVDS